MKITVKIRKIFDNAGALKAVASVTLGDMFVVHGVKVIETAKGSFMAMPEEVYKDKDGKDARRDIFHPINSEARATMEAAVLSAYDAAVSKATEVTEEAPAETTENN